MRFLKMLEGSDVFGLLLEAGDQLAVRFHCQGLMEGGAEVVCDGRPVATLTEGVLTAQTRLALIVGGPVYRKAGVLSVKHIRFIRVAREGYLIHDPGRNKWPRLRLACRRAGMTPAHSWGGAGVLRYPDELVVPDYSMSGSHWFLVRRQTIDGLLKTVPLSIERFEAVHARREETGRLLKEALQAAALESASYIGHLILQEDDCIEEFRITLQFGRRREEDLFIGIEMKAGMVSLPLLNASEVGAFLLGLSKEDLSESERRSPLPLTGASLQVRGKVLEGGKDFSLLWPHWSEKIAQLRIRLRRLNAGLKSAHTDFSAAVRCG